MKKIGVLFTGLAIMAVMSANCDGSASSSSRFNAGTYFPLTAGKQYDYLETTPEGSGHVTLEFENSRQMDGIPEAVTPMKELIDGGNTGEITYYATDTGTGLQNYGEDDLEAGCVERLSPAFSIPNGLVPGRTLTQSVALSATGNGSNCLHAARVDYMITYEDEETVTVPLGTYKHCAKIRIIDKWVNKEGITVSQENKLLFFAPHIGMVKEVEFTDKGEETIVLKAIR